NVVDDLDVGEIAGTVEGDQLATTNRKQRGIVAVSRRRDPNEIVSTIGSVQCAQAKSSSQLFGKGGQAYKRTVRPIIRVHRHKLSAPFRDQKITHMKAPRRPKP